MSLKAKKRTGWLGTWFAKVTDGRRPATKNRTRKLRCEALERRELLSVSVVTGAQTYLTVPVTTTNGSATGTANGTAYQANANLTGTITYTNATSATVTGNLNGTIVTPPNSGNFAATIPASGSTVSLNNGAISGSVNVTAPSSVGVVSASGTINVSQTSGNNTTITWPQSGTSQLGQWTGTIVSTNSTPYNVVLATPVWHSANESQIDISFTNAGTWDLNHYGGISTNIVAYWSADGTLTNATPIGTVQVAWNQASGTASIQGISGSIPAGMNYVLIQGQDSTTNAPDTNLVALNLNTPFPWVVVGTGDVNNDKKADVIWQNLNTGVVTAWITGGASQTLGQASSTVWKVVGVGDFNGDGKADVLLQDVKTGDANYGLVGVWITGGALQWLGQADPSVWKLAGTGDFSGDSKADVLWQDTKAGDASYGAVGVWITGGALQWLGQADPSVWKLAGVGDFNGDHKADVLWQDTKTGDASFGLVGAWITGGAMQWLGQADPTVWALSGAADFNGDSKADVLWENVATADVGAWTTGGGWQDLGVI